MQSMQTKIAITGATSGFGVNWLYQLDAKVNAEIFVLARNKAKFDALMLQRPLRNKVFFVACNLASLNSVIAAAQEISKQTDHLDILINNAGVWSPSQRTESEDGFELTLAVNQLAPFVLTQQLLPLLKAAPAARVVNTASFRHADAKIDRHDIELHNHFSAELAYCNSKLCSILFTKALAQRLVNTDITVNCFDPGIVNTPMLKQAFPKALVWLYPLVSRWLARSPDKGAETGVLLSLSADFNNTSGAYLKDAKPAKLSKQAQDPDLATWLWDESERLLKSATGLTNKLGEAEAKANLAGISALALN